MPGTLPSFSDTDLPNSDIQNCQVSEHSSKLMPEAELLWQRMPVAELLASALAKCQDQHVHLDACVFVNVCYTFSHDFAPVLH